MDAGLLKVFETVARTGSMSRAAAELNTVQSNVTARVRLLERQLGVELFQRHSRGVVPTAAGRRLLPYARRVERLLAEARCAAAADGPPQGTLVVGSLETTAALHLSPVLARYAAAYPAVDLVLRTGTTRELIDAVLGHELEAAFVCGPLDHPELTGAFAFRERLVLVTPPGVESAEALRQQANPKIVVLRAGCSYRQRLEDILARAGVGGLRLLEFGTLDTILGAVAGGLGVTLLPRRSAAAAAREGRVALHELPDREAEVETLLIRRRDALVSPALAAFRALACTPAPEAATARPAAE